MAGGRPLLDNIITLLSQRVWLCCISMGDRFRNVHLENGKKTTWDKSISGEGGGGVIANWLWAIFFSIFTFFLQVLLISFLSLFAAGFVLRTKYKGCISAWDGKGSEFHMNCLIVVNMVQQPRLLREHYIYFFSSHFTFWWILQWCHKHKPELDPVISEELSLAFHWAGTKHTDNQNRV